MRSISPQNISKLSQGALLLRSLLLKLKKRGLPSGSIKLILFLFGLVGNQKMKKVHPLEIINSSSISNISTNEVLENSTLRQCRYCKKGNDQEMTLIFPCTCREPIHKSCLAGEMQSSFKKVRRIRTADKEKRYNCSRCAEVIRFNCLEELTCRTCREVGVFSKENCCMCASLTVASLLVCGMLIFLVLLKSTAFQMASDVLLQSAVIGCSIAIAVILLIVLYFLVSEVLLKVNQRVELIRSGQERKGRITIQDCS